ncbi:hypothetical protein ACN08Z_05560 [Rothia sp. P7181]|uniref:hypothetical protein n=1 Tax=unclassified Rothia (in: high G+C Gram-positive bacteria) TaxID=2689056 RepID=UPI003AC9FC17
MNYLLVGVTFLVLAVTMMGVAVLGSDRLYPLRKTLVHMGEDGIDFYQHPSAQVDEPSKTFAEYQEFSREELITALIKTEHDNLALRDALAEKEASSSQ